MTIHLTDIFSGSSGAAWLPLADAIIKATLLFATAALASVALRKATAAARHLVWALALVSAMVLPLLSLALPRWQLPVVTLASSPTSAAEDPLLNGSPAPPIGVRAPSAPRTATPRDSATARSVPFVSGPETARIPLQNVPWRDLLLAAWLIGAAGVLLRLVTGLVGVQCLSRRTDRVKDAPWLPLARALATQLGLANVIFHRSARATMPMAWGILRPAVLMPSDADGWPAERLRIVLLHELAHVKRRDCLTHMLAQLTCALYWFNPLVWVAARHLRTERERACDDLVLAAGTRGSDYADQLLEIARRTRGDRFPRLLGAASLAMAQRSQLEGRLMAILDPTVPRSGVSRLRMIAASSAVAFAVVPLAAVQPWTIEAPRATRPIATAIFEDPNQQIRVGEMPGSFSGERPIRRDRVQPERAAVPTAPVVEAVPVFAPFASVPAGDLGGRTPFPAAAAVPVVTPMSQPGSTAGAQTSTDAGSSNARNGKEKSADPRTVAALTAALKDTDKGVRDTALQALVQLRDPGIFDPLLQSLADVEADVREQAAFGLGQLRDRRAVEPLARALKDQNADVREQAAFALGQIRDRAAVGALTSALKDLDDDVREQAVFALGQLRDPAAVDALAATMRDAKADVRQQAVFALGQLRDRRAVEPLISALKDADADVRAQAAFALGQIGDRAAVEALIIALKDTVVDVRGQVVFALGQIRDARAIDALTAALKDASADVRQQAAFALGQLVR